MTPLLMATTAVASACREWSSHPPPPPSSVWGQRAACALPGNLKCRHTETASPRTEETTVLCLDALTRAPLRNPNGVKEGATPATPASS